MGGHARLEKRSLDSTTIRERHGVGRKVRQRLWGVDELGARGTRVPTRRIPPQREGRAHCCKQDRRHGYGSFSTRRTLPGDRCGVEARRRLMGLLCAMIGLYRGIAALGKGAPSELGWKAP